MKARSWRQISVLAILMTALATAIGCSGVGTQTPEDGGQQLPFSESKPLFVPANTVIFVRLRQSITSSTAQAGQSFAAVLDEPLLVDNQTVAPQGAEVAGKVVAVRESGRLRTSGYVRITLSAITFNGKTIAMQTNSAIAGGGSFRHRDLGFLRTGAGGSPFSSFQATGNPESGKKEAGFPADSRIGFRLTRPLNLT